jgi:hypothetical protein
VSVRRGSLKTRSLDLATTTEPKDDVAALSGSEAFGEAPGGSPMALGQARQPHSVGEGRSPRRPPRRARALTFGKSLANLAGEAHRLMAGWRAWRGRAGERMDQRLAGERSPWASLNGTPAQAGSARHILYLIVELYT